jgi:hypothetical protein
MTNTGLTEIINQYGDRIFAFGYDNASVLYIGYNSMSSAILTDIELVTIGEVDLIKVKKTSSAQGKALNYHTFTETSKIQWIGIMDEDSVAYRVDPLILR